MNESSWTVILARNKKMINEEQTIDYREGNEMIQKLYVEKSSLRKRKEKKRKEKKTWIDLKRRILYVFMYLRRNIGYHFVFWIVLFRLLNLKVQVISHDRSSVKPEQFYYTSEREKVLGVFSPVVW